MPALVRWYLKTAIAFLALGLLLGAVMIVRREIGGVYPSSYLVSAHTHALLVGFVLMMIFGVALWMFPRPVGGDRLSLPRSATVAYVLLAGGTLVRFVGEVGRSWSASPALRWAIATAGVLQVVGALCVFIALWPRIRASGGRA
jgi:heme/copper-type cytochrome/quinol oxidase subunit 1